MTSTVSATNYAITRASCSPVSLTAGERSKELENEPSLWLPGKRHFEDAVNDPDAGFLEKYEVDVPQVPIRSTLDLALQEYVLGYDEDVPEDISELYRGLELGRRETSDENSRFGTLH